jgi:3-hydroxyisobutyrate dehydrogenase
MAITDSVGFVGIGNMGWPMAANIARAGVKISVFDTDTALAQRFAQEMGATAAPDLETLGATSDVIVTMLPTGAIVRAVFLKAEGGGLAAALKSGSVVVDMSSSEPIGTQELGAELANQDIVLIDAPVSGGIVKAVEGTLAIMTGSDNDAALERVTPVLSAMGDRLFRAGGLGAGHAVKALNNYIAAAAFTAASESLIIGEEFGIDREVILNIVNNSTGRCFNTEIPIKDDVLPRRFATGFKLGLMAKDVKIAADLADALGLSAPMSDFTRQSWGDASTAVGPDEDFTAAITHWEKLAK